MRFKITKNKVIAGIAILIILACAFWYGGGAPGLQGWNSASTDDEEYITDNEGLLYETTKNLDAKEDSKQEPEAKDKAEPGQDNKVVLNETTKNLDAEEDAKQEPEAKDKAEPDQDNKVLAKETTKKSDAKEDSKQKPEVEDKSKAKAKSKDKKETTGLESRPGGVKGDLSAKDKVELAKKLAEDKSSATNEKGSKDHSESDGMEINPSTGKDKYQTDPVPEGKPIPVEPEDSKVTDKKATATLSVRCDTILDNMDWLNPEKVELVPQDGVIFDKQTVTFYAGESVFDILQREMRNAGIHMEFTFTPMYNSVYVEGINNLYEFDCGELSGWMYKVNNWFPNYGASRYAVKQGDVIEWVYTCDLGVDVGGFYSVGANKK